MAYCAVNGRGGVVFEKGTITTENKRRTTVTLSSRTKTAASKPITPQQRAIRIFILTVGAVVMLCFLLADPLLRHYRKDDFKNAVPQEGTATVITLVIPPANIEGDTKGEQTPLVGVRFRDGVYNARRAYDVKHFHIGQSAHIVYRAGKSGAIVVESAEPLPDTPAPTRSTRADIP